jgi:hypothetical protein
MTPGSTTARSSSGTTATTARIFDVTISTPSACGRAPPESPVPEPRATNGTPAATQARTVRAHSAASRGSTTSPGTTL